MVAGHGGECDTSRMGPSGEWLERRVISYAHRAGALEAPSSTVYAIERAVALGATGIELDVHADGRMGKPGDLHTIPPLERTPRTAPARSRR